MEKCWKKNGALRNSSINWIFLRRLPIQNNSKSSFTEKRSHRPNNLPEILIDLILKMGKPMSTADVAPDLIRALNNFIWCNCRRIISWSRISETILEIRKKATFILVIKKLIIHKLFKDFTNHRKKMQTMLLYQMQKVTPLGHYIDDI